MNILFGILTASMPIFIALYMAFLRVITWKHAARFAVVYALFVGLYAGATYGPRNTVDAPQATSYTPEVQRVEPSPDLFTTEKDRVGQFDERLKDKPPK